MEERITEGEFIMIKEGGFVGSLLGQGKRKAGKAYEKGLMNLMGSRSKGTSLRTEFKNTGRHRFIKKDNLKNKISKNKTETSRANKEVKGMRDAYKEESKKTNRARGGAAILALGGGGAYSYDKQKQAKKVQQGAPIRKSVNSAPVFRYEF